MKDPKDRKPVDRETQKIVEDKNFTTFFSNKAPRTKVVGLSYQPTKRNYYG